MSRSRRDSNTEAQLEKDIIINSTEPNILVVAGAGTGKTWTLCNAAKAYINKNTVIITFTNNAANELKERLGEGNYFIGTIHKYAIQELKKLSYEKNFTLNILNSKQIEKIIIRLMHDIEIDPYREQLRECVHYITNRQDFIKTHNDVPEMYELIYKNYQKYKNQTNFHDFTDAPQYLVEKLKYYNLNLSIDALFVDEAQDLSDDQFELIQLINADKKVIIGDPRQSIYQFRGANGQVFEQFKNIGYKLYELHYNFRSKQEILDFANANLIAANGSGGQIYTNIYDLLLLQPQILARTNYEVNRIKKYYKNVCTIHQAKGLEYDNVLVVSFEIQNDEDNNVLYTALTRAKEGLGVFDFKEVLKNISLKNF